MKREIKFRAWAIEDKKMFYPDTAEYGNDVKNGVVFNTSDYEKSIRSILNIMSNGYLLIDLVIMQWSGLKDVKGNDIYEGDLVRYDLGEREQQMGADRYEYGKVVFEYGAFQVVTDDGCMDLLCDGGQEPTVEVIGNIYEK